MQISERISAEIGGFDYTINLHGVIGPPEEYGEEFNLLSGLQENDSVTISINTPGGDLDCAIQFIHAIKNCRGTVYGKADGQVSSAGSIIFFSCHAWLVGDFSYFMQHDGSSGTWGKISDNHAKSKADSKLLEKIYRRVYGPFFTEDEITDILRGVDIHLTSEEVIERLEKYEEDQRTEAELEEDKVTDFIEALSGGSEVIPSSSASLDEGEQGNG